MGSGSSSNCVPATVVRLAIKTLVVETESVSSWLRMQGKQSLADQLKRFVKRSRAGSNTSGRFADDGGNGGNGGTGGNASRSPPVQVSGDAAMGAIAVHSFTRQLADVVTAGVLADGDGDCDVDVVG